MINLQMKYITKNIKVFKIKVFVYTISISNPKITNSSMYFFLSWKYGNKIINVTNKYTQENQLGFVRLYFR